MSGSGSGSNNPSNSGHGPIRITLPNPNSLKPSSPSRSSSSSSSSGSSSSSYPFPAPYSSSQSKPLQNKTLPSPAHILREAAHNPHQDSYLNNYSNAPSYQYSSSNTSSSYSSPNSSPDNSPRPAHTTRDMPYTLPSLNLNPSSSRGQSAGSSYSSPIPFVTSSPTAFASTAKIPLKISAAQLAESQSPSPPPQYSGNPNFSPPSARHARNLPPPQQPLASPPSSPTHDPYAHHGRGYSNFPPSSSSKYSSSYMDSPPPKGPKSSPTLPSYQPRLPSPTALQAPPSPARSNNSHLSHSSIPPSPIRQAQDMDDEYEDEVMESSAPMYSPAKSRDHDQATGMPKGFHVQSEPLSVHIPRAQGSPIPFEPYGDSNLANSKELKKKKDLKRKEGEKDYKEKDKDNSKKDDPKLKRRKKSIGPETPTSSSSSGKKELVAPSSPLRRSGGVRKKRPASPTEGAPVNSPRPGPITPNSPITPTPISLSSSSSVSNALPPLPAPVPTPIVPSKVFSAFNPDTLHQDVLEHVELLEREFLASEDADSKLRTVIESRYPFDKKTLFDYLLTNFVLFHPEYTHTVIAPLAQKIAAKQLSYAKKNPPFYSFLTLFSPPPPSRSSKINHFPCQQILWTLTRHNLSPKLLSPSSPSSSSPTAGPMSTPLPLSSWIADLLIEASPTLRETYITELVNLHIKQQQNSSAPPSFAPPSTSSLNPLEQSGTEKMNFVRQIVSLVEEERKTKSFVICNTVVPIIIRGLPNQLALFSDVIKYYFSQPTTEQTHKTIRHLFSSETSENVPHAQLVFVLSMSIFAHDTTQWFSQHFLEPILHGITENLRSTETLLKEIFFKKDYSSLLFGREDLPDSAKFIQFADAISTHSKDLQQKVLKIWRNTWSGKYGQEGAPSWERLSQFIATSSPLSSKIPEITEMSKSVFRSFLVSQQKSRHVLLAVARFFLLGEKLQSDAKWGELATYFEVFIDFLSEVSEREIWILKELEAQFLTCIQILRNMDITSHPSDKVVTVLAESSTPTHAYTNKNNITLATKNGVYLILLAISGTTRFGKFLRTTITQHHACAQNLLCMVMSRDTETRAFVLRLFVCLEGDGKASEMSDGNGLNVGQGLGEKFWKMEQISYVVNALKDSHISNLAQDLLKILCENYAGTPPLVLGLLWQCLLDAQCDPQTLVLDMEWILVRFPEHVNGVVGKIGRALFLPTNFQANLGTSNGNHFLYGYPNPYLLILLQKINSFPNFKLPDNLLEKALDNIPYYPDDIQLLQFQLFEGCLDFHNKYNLVEDRIATVLQGSRSTCKSVREVSTAIIHKFAEQDDKNRRLISQYAPHYLQSHITQEAFNPFLRDTL